MKKLIDFPFERILVLGLAKSGTAAAELLLKSGKNVRINDMQASEEDLAISKLKSMGAEVILGSHPFSVLENIEIIVKNPGIPYDIPILQEAIKREIPIITEIEIAGRLVEGTIIGITGSNGKTTTTTLIHQMLLDSQLPVKIAGNIGTVATDVAQVIDKDEKMVLELSSFQLLGVQTFRPNIAVLLNVYEAHLDYHKTLHNYQLAKFNIFRNQNEEDYLVYNLENKIVLDAAKTAKSKLVPFSTKRKLETGAWADDSSVYFKDEKIIDIQDIVLVGDHNLENILAAICAAKLSGATNEGICNVLTTFSGVEHRLQFVRNVENRLFYNDSKATNILATQKALNSFQQPIILLAGGLDRGTGFTDLIPYLDHVKTMILFGQTKEKLGDLAKEANIPYKIVDDIDVAVREAYDLSEADDIILLSPACASWDQFRTFEERGDMFIQAVHKL